MIINALSNIILIFLIFILWNYFLKKYAIDKFREELFLIREKLFNIALEEKDFNFNKALYRNFEDILNGTIQYAHRISFFNLTFLLFLYKIFYPNYKIKSKLSIEFERNINNIQSDKIKKLILNLKSNMEIEIIKYMFKTSILFKTYFLILSIPIFIKDLFSISLSNTINKLKKYIKLKMVKEFNEIEYQADLLTSTCN